MQRDIPHGSSKTLQSDVSSRLDLWDRHIHAFVTLADPATPIDASGTPDGGRALADVSVGVKDVIDVAGLPTRNGSLACRDTAPAPLDAPVVADLRAAGATIVGKTVSTEFAFTDPTDCRNPYDLDRSPGGSSSGSGAAVAAGIVDIALGTQTAGSLCRPAAYCGAVGFKPTYGVLATGGVTPLAPSFDTIGLIAGSVALAKRAFAALHPTPIGNADIQAADSAVLAALFETPVVPSAAMTSALAEASQAIEQIDIPLRHGVLQADAGAIVATHRIVMNYEAANAHHALLQPERLALLQPKFRAGLLAGAEISATQAEQARTFLADAKDAFWADHADVDIILTLAVPEGAPMLGATTGFQDWLTPWTVFGGPLICLPWGLDDLARPRAIMLAARPGQDARLLSFAAGLERRAPALSRPTLPVAAPSSAVE